MHAGWAPGILGGIISPSLKQGLSSRMMMVGACGMGSWYTGLYKCMRDRLQVCMLLVVIIITHEANAAVIEDNAYSWHLE